VELKTMLKFQHLLIFIVSIFLLSCSDFGNVSSLPKSEKDFPLVKFILGEWEGSKQIVDPNQSYQIIYKINFKSESTFELIRTSPNNSDYDYSDEFTYQFTNENTIQVQSSRVTNARNWMIARNTDNLNVCFSENDCVLLVRKNFSFTWWLILISVFAILGILIYIRFKKKRSVH
jgi:hypothetical protein